ncbi:MAG: glucose-6-phosphate isomerase [Oscillospiraceae bacterium]|jgi:glucose-6-phosphate isomerase|nr:glucose-6-phosphate isomerase [Oscillospiraceae bacterium]
MALELITKYTGGQLPGGAQAAELSALAKQAHLKLEEGTGQGAGMRGWLRFPREYPKDEEYARIKAAAREITGQAEALLVIGIGGSYLGARAVIEAAASRYYNELPRQGAPAIYFTGNTLSESDFDDLDKLIAGKRFCINVISKSGKTLETAVAFRYYKAKLLESCGGDADEMNRRIYVTTDPAEGALLRAARDNGWRTFVVPKDMGGRYSVLSAVGLLPIACAGIDVDKLMEGAAAAQAAYEEPGEAFGQNACDDYAALRFYYYKYRGKAIEIFASYEPSMVMFGEWYKQLFGESEGKRGRALFPASVTFTTDLHSLGQYIQQGRRILFETVVTFETAAKDIAMWEEPGDGDGLNYLARAKLTLHRISRTAFRATAQAHAEGKCPSLVLGMGKRDAYSIGWLVYFFEKACAISGYMIGVNPFNQKGVEEYKDFMFALLGKRGKNSKKVDYDKVREQLAAKGIRAEGLEDESEI